MNSQARAVLLVAIILTASGVGLSQDGNAPSKKAPRDEGLQGQIDYAVAWKWPTWTLVEKLRFDTNTVESRWDAGSLRATIITQHFATTTDADRVLQEYRATICCTGSREVEGIGDKAYLWEEYGRSTLRFRRGNVVVTIDGMGKPAEGSGPNEASEKIEGATKGTDDKTKPRTLILAQPVSRESIVEMAHVVIDEIDDRVFDEQ